MYNFFFKMMTVLLLKNLSGRSTSWTKRAWSMPAVYTAPGPGTMDRWVQGFHTGGTIFSFVCGVYFDRNGIMI